MRNEGPRVPRRAGAAVPGWSAGERRAGGAGSGGGSAEGAHGDGVPGEPAAYQHVRGCRGWSLPSVRITTAWEAGVAVSLWFHVEEEWRGSLPVSQAGAAGSLLLLPSPAWMQPPARSAAGSFSSVPVSRGTASLGRGKDSRELALPVVGKGHTTLGTAHIDIHHPPQPRALPCQVLLPGIFPAKARVLMAHPHRCQRLRFSFARGTQSALAPAVTLGAGPPVRW